MTTDSMKPVGKAKRASFGPGGTRAPGAAMSSPAERLAYRRAQAKRFGPYDEVDPDLRSNPKAKRCYY